MFGRSWRVFASEGGSCHRGFTIVLIQERHLSLLPSKGKPDNFPEPCCKFWDFKAPGKASLRRTLARHSTFPRPCPHLLWGVHFEIETSGFSTGADGAGKYRRRPLPKGNSLGRQRFLTTLRDFPCPSFPYFILEFLVFPLARMCFFFFLSVFPFFSRDMKGSKGINNSCFFGSVVIPFFQRKKGPEGQGCFG